MNRKSVKETWRPRRTIETRTTYTTQKKSARPHTTLITPQPRASQHWTVYRALDSHTRYCAPDQTNPTWEKFEPLRLTNRGILYENKIGTPCRPQEKGYKISLASGSPTTLIYTDSCSRPVSLKQPQIDQVLICQCHPSISQR